MKYFKRNLCDGGLLNPTEPIPCIPSQAILHAKPKLSPIKNPRDIHIHSSLLNVVIHMPRINISMHTNFNLKNFLVKIFLWGTLENQFIRILNTWIFHTWKFPNLRYIHTYMYVCNALIMYLLLLSFCWTWWWLLSILFLHL